MCKDERGEVGADVLHQLARPGKSGKQHGYSGLPVTLAWKINICLILN